MPGKWRRTVRKSNTCVALAPMPADRPEKAAELIPLIGQLVTLTYGLGSQQTKHVAQGNLRDVTPRFAQIDADNGQAVRIPLNWIIRYAQ